MGRLLLSLIAIGFIVWTVATSLTQVNSGQRAVIRRFGRIRDAKPDAGLYVGWPWGIERVDLVPVGKVRQLTVGFLDKDEKTDDVIPVGQMLTGDHNLVNVQAEIHYRVRDDAAEKFVLQADNVDALIARAAESLLAEWIAGREIDYVWTQGKIVLPGVLRERLQKRLQDYDLGLEIELVSIPKLDPPDQVKGAFDRLTQAHTSIRTSENKAEQEANQQLSLATGKANVLRQSAHSYADEELRKANAEANSFRQRLARFRELPGAESDKLRALWLDEMTRLYARMKQEGRLDLLDHHLTGEGITITQFPLPSRKK